MPDCPIDPSYLTPPLRGTQFEQLYHLGKVATICKDLSVLAKWDIDNLDPSILPHLAQELAVFGDRGWNLADTDELKRTLLKNAIRLHRLAGTPAAIKEILLLLGFGEVTIEENPQLTYDGSWTYNSSEVYNEKKWDRFIITFATPVPAQKEELVNRLIDSWKNERSRRINTVVLLRYDGEWDYDGAEIYDGYLST